MYSRLRPALVLALLSFVAQARRNPNETQPEDFVGRVVRTYQSLVNDQFLKSGRIGDLMKRNELRYLSEADRKAIERSIVYNQYFTDVKYSVKGMVITLSDSRLVGDKPLAIDFRDYTADHSKVIYLGERRYALRYIDDTGKPGVSRLVEQLRDFKEFWNGQKAQAYFPGLDQKQSLWASNGLQLLLFPITLVTGCNESGSARDYFLGAALQANSCKDGELTTTCLETQSALFRSPSSHDSPKKP